MAESPACPRCGYDQRGVIDSWTHSCPLMGVCSECGHTLRWAEVLDPAARLDPWFAEHAGTGRRASLRIAVTWMWVAFPWIFWNRVGVKLPISIRRMVLWLGVPLIAIHVIAGAVRSSTIWLLWPSPWYEWFHLELIVAWLGPLVSVRGDRFQMIVALTPGSWPHPITVLVSISLGMPLLLFMLSATRRACRLRRGHVWRASIYGLAWLIPLAIARASSYLETLVDVYPGTSRLPWSVLEEGNNWIDIQLHAYPWQWGSALIIWCVVWWWCAIARGFRLPDAGIVCSLLMLVCLLLAGVVLVNSPSFLLEYFG